MQARETTIHVQSHVSECASAGALASLCIVYDENDDPIL